MVITGISRRRRRLYQLSVDGTEGPLVDVTTFDESPYREGSTLTEAQMEALLELSDYNRARERALYLLSLRDYAAGELEKKLREEAAPETAHRVVEKLTEYKLLDDEAYAARRAQSLSRHKQYPRRRVMQELLRRGVERETAQNAVEELETEDYQQALAILRKKYYNKLSDKESRQKVMAALARRGFGFDAVRRALSLWDEENGATVGDEDEEIEAWQ